MKKKRIKDYTQEELNNLSYSEREALIRDHTISIMIKAAIGIILGIFLLTLIFGSMTTVDTGFVGVKTRFGQVQDTMIQEGFNGKVPFIEKIVKIDCRTQKTEYMMEASSKDLQKVSNMKVAVNYNVDKSRANQLYREVGTEFNSVIVEPAIFECVKQGVSQYTAEELITKRSEVSNVILKLLTDRLSVRGITVTALNITDLSFSQEFDAAIEKKQVTEQQTQQAKYELEKAKVENQKKIENAKAEAEVMRQQNNQITDKTLELKRLEVMNAYINKWDGKLPSTMLNDNINGLFKIGE